MKTKGTDPRKHFPWWFWDGILQIKVQQSTGTWPREGGLQKQSSSLVKLVRGLIDANFLRRGSLLG